MSHINDCNIAFKLEWIDNACQGNSLIEIAIDVWTKNGYMHQIFYTTNLEFEQFGQRLVDKSYSLDEVMNISFRESGFHPAVHFCLLAADVHGVVPIEVDLQILDNPNETARCQMRVEAELGMLERFGKAVQRVAYGTVGGGCKLNPDLPARCVPCEWE